MQSCLDILPQGAKRVLVAYSGGLDSSVLLHLLMQREASYEILPWHINHGLAAAAEQMEQFCIARIRDYGLEPIVDRLHLQRIDSNIEAEARRQRYRLFEQRSRAGDCILTAHHADDQAETFLLNALRGSGSAGLRGIAPRRRLGEAWLLRPLLPYSRKQLEAYAAAHEIAWFNDPSNRDSRFDRNYLRNEVIPPMRRRWPHLHQAFATASELQAETQSLLDELAAGDLRRLRRAESAGAATLDLDGLIEMNDARRHNLIRYWIAESGMQPLPRARLLELDQQMHARPEATPEVSMADYSVRIYARRLFLVADADWHRGGGEYDFGLAQTIEIETPPLRMSRHEILARLQVADEDQALTLRFRNRGQKNPDRHRLKRLFQKHRVPPWRRAAVAQVYLDGKLAGILP